MAARKMDKSDFDTRIKQISNPRNKSYYDPDLGMHVPKRVMRDKIKHTNEEPSVIGILLVSLVLGAVALMFAQIVRIRYFGVLEPSTSILVLEIVLAIWAVVLLSVLTDKRSVAERLAQIAGVAVMMVAGHNLIWRWPDQMSTIYTSAYVEQVLETTTQNSIVYRGSVYGL